MPFQAAHQDEERVAVPATEFSKVKTQDVAGVEEHDSEGNRWFRPKRLRRHTFYLCTVCRWMFDNDLDFQAEIEKKASNMQGRAE